MTTQRIDSEEFTHIIGRNPRRGRLPEGLKILPFDARHLVTDIIIEQRVTPEGKPGVFLLETLRCSVGDKEKLALQDYEQLLRDTMVAPDESEDVALSDATDGARNLTEWAMWFFRDLRAWLEDHPHVFAHNVQGMYESRIMFSCEVTIQHNGRASTRERMLFRVSRALVRRGSIFRIKLRRVFEGVPELAEINYTNPLLRRFLADSKRVAAEGLVGIVGQYANGKTTACSSLAVHHVEADAREAFSVEMPPELDMDGFWGAGEFCQLHLNHDLPLATAIKSALADTVQAFSTHTRGSIPILMIGEVADPITAETIVTHGNDGKCVMFTAHAPSAVATPQRLIDLNTGLPGGAEAARAAIASGLRLVVHQKMAIELPDEGLGQTRALDCARFTARILYSRGSDSPVADAIRGGHSKRLGELEQQQNQLLERLRSTYAEAGSSEARDHVYEQFLDELDHIGRE